MIYLASNYSDPDPERQQLRYAATMKYLAKITREGGKMFSPIVHFHEVAKHYHLPTDAKFYKHYNLQMMMFCSHMHCLLLTGWRVSSGLNQEIDWWQQNKETKIVYVHGD